MKPTISEIKPFDADLGVEVNYKWSGDALRKLKVVISNNSTGDDVYTPDAFETYINRFTIPAFDVSGLQNGGVYKIKIQALTGVNEEESEWSDEVLFYCFSTPNFTAQGAVADGDNQKISIHNSSFVFVVQYIQDEGEPLNVWEINLYNGNDIVVESSGELYYASTDSHRFSGFTETESTYVVLNGTTVHGMNITSKKIKLEVNFNVASNFVNFEATNNAARGNIKVQSNAVSIVGEPLYEDVTYVQDSSNNDYAVDLSNNAVLFNSGFIIPGDFAYYIRLPELYYDNPFLKLSTTDGNESIEFWLIRETVGSNIQYYITATDSKGAFKLYSNRLLNLDQTVEAKTLNGHWRLNGHTVLSGGNITLEKINEEVGIEFGRTNGNYYLMFYDSSYSHNFIAPKSSFGSKEYYLNTTGFNYQGVFTEIVISYGIFDEMYIATAQINNWDGTFPDSWNSNTILHAYFNGTLMAGSIESSVGDTSGVRLKRRVKGAFGWKTLYWKEVNTESDFSFEFYDFLNASSETYEYAYVPVLNDGTERPFITCEVNSSFRNYYLCEYDVDTNTTTVYPAIIEPEFSLTYNQETSSQTTLGNKYPYVIKNGDIGYYSGSLTATFVNVDSNCNWDWEGGVKYRRALDQFLTDGKPKILKDWLGNIHMVLVTDSIQRGDGEHYYTPTQEINWVECGDCSSIGDLYDNGFINTDYDRE